MLAACFAASLALLGIGPTAARAQTLNSYTFASLSDNPTFYCNFNELSGNAIDQVRKQVNDQLAPSGSSTRSASFAPALSSAATMTGNGGFGANALADGQMSGAWAIEMWAKANGPQITPNGSSGFRSDYLLNAGGSDVNNGGNNPGVIYDFDTGTGDNNFGLFSGAGRTDNQVGAPKINNGNWHHYVWTFYGNGAGFGVADRVDIAVDGVVQTVPRGGFSSGFGLNNALVLGSAFANGTNGFEGQMDEVAFYDLSNMSTAQVAAKTQAIANHFNLADDSPATDKYLVDPSDISYSYAPTPAVQPNPLNNRNDPLAGTPGAGKLINGVIASTNTGANLSDGSTVGLNDPNGFNGDNGAPHPGLTFNLGGVHNIDEIWIDYIGANSAAGVAAPDRVDVTFSNDGVNFGNLMSIANFNDTSSVPGMFFNRRLVADIGGVSAEFVRLNFFNNQEWTFLSEVQFVAQAVPEPGSLVLWTFCGAGALGVCVARRRRIVRRV
jgi:hypothetical protein